MTRTRDGARNGGSRNKLTAMDVRIPISATTPRLVIASFEAKLSEPKPIAVETPQKITALPVPCHIAARSPPFRRKAKPT